MQPAVNEQLQARILTVVAKRFVNLKEATARKDLILQFEDSWAIGDLVNRNILRRKDSASPEEYLPTVAAFQFCDDSQLRETAKMGTTVVLHALRNIYRVESKLDFTFADLLDHVRRIYPDGLFDEETLKLGLYLVQDFAVLAGNRMNAPDNTEITSFRVGETIITTGDLDKAWDVVTSRYKSAAPLVPGQRRARPRRLTNANDDQVFLPAGSQHDAYVQLRKIVKLTNREILVVDPYVDQTLWELLTNVSPKVTIRILTEQMKGDFRLEGRKFAA